MQKNAIFQQCPDEGGPAVYRARSLYAWHGAADFNGSYCQPAAARQSLPPQAAEPVPREKDGRFRAFPNPNQGSFTLEYELEAAGLLLLTGLMGRGLAPIALPAGRQRLEAAPEGLKAGVYLLRVVSEAGVLLHAEKIIIIR
jgi:hypothetical protein